MFRKMTEYERAYHIHKFLTTGEPFNLNRDLGDIYQISSDGKDLKFYDMVKLRKTGKYYKGKEIILLNVTPYGYVNLEGRSKWNLMQEFEYLFEQLFFGFKIKTYKEEVHNRYSILSRKSSFQHGKIVPIEREEEHKIRSNALYNNCVKMALGVFNKYELFFIGDDHQMVKPIDYTGYFYYLARCLNDVETHHYRDLLHKNRLELFFGCDAVDFNERYHTYTEIAEIIEVQTKMRDVSSRFYSLKYIQSDVKSRIYIFHEVAKYFFKNGRQFSEQDHKDIKKLSYNIRMIYSALGGKFCMKKNEYKKNIAYFTAIRCSKDDLPLLINTTNEAAMGVLMKRFDLSR